MTSLMNQPGEPVMVDHVEIPVCPSTALTVQAYSSFDELPNSYLALFDDAGRQNFFLTLGWFRNFAATVVDPGAHLRVYGIAQKDDPQVVMGLFAASFSSLQGRSRKISALANFYSCFFAPHLAGPARQVRETLRSLVMAIAAERPRYDVINIQPLDVNSESFGGLVEALQSARFVVQTFFVFGNWYLPVKGRSFEEYLQGRPAVLRNTLSRKRKKLEKSGRARIEIITGGEGLEEAINAYTTVYLASWKRREPYPEFIPGLIRLCAEMGVLRLGLVHVDGEPAAAQLWIVHNGAALIYKLAYDERFADLSAGTILTGKLMQHVLDVDKVQVVDYLSGDDAYKKDWMSDRRERWGILAMNPRTPQGLIAILRHVGGRAAKHAVLWISSRLPWKRPPDITPPQETGPANSGEAVR
jgi:CelD/BcsL family acetyltransferase involved in cellulose biosynthesis